MGAEVCWRLVMKKILAGFAKSEAGAVTVDWIVLTAAMTGFGVAVAMTITNAATDEASGIGGRVGAITIEYECGAGRPLPQVDH